MFDFLNRNSPDSSVDVQAEFVANVQHAADQFVAAVAPHIQDASGRGSPYCSGLDYSVSSVALVDALAEQVASGQIVLDVMQTLGISAYLYEVARRHYDGLYEVCDDDDPVVLVTGEPDFDVCLCAISFVQRKLEGQTDESAPAYFARYIAAVQARASDMIR